MASKGTLTMLTSELNTAQKDVVAVINAVVDENSFVETDRFIGADTVLGSATGEGVVCGFATLNDVNVGIFATNANVLKGSIGKQNSQKIARLVDNAVKMNCPLVAIFDTSGARLGEGIEAVEGYASVIKSFSDACELIPIVTVNKGKNFGISSYLSAFGDVCIGYDKSELSTSSPLIVAATAGAADTATGTAKVVAEKTGLYTCVVKSDAELKDTISKVLDAVNLPFIDSEDDLNRVSKALKVGVKVETQIAEIFDTNSFISLRASYAADVVTGFARLGGQSVGVIGFAGKESAKIDSKSAGKVIDMISLCASYKLPIISLVDCDGTVIDMAQENDQLITTVANMLYTINSATVPKISLVVGSAVGIGYTAFASKSACDYVLAWPDAKIGAVSSVKMAELLYAEEIGKSKNKDAAAKKLAGSYADENQTAVALCKKGYFDNVIDPAFSRSYLIAAVRMFSNNI